MKYNILLSLLLVLLVGCGGAQVQSDEGPTQDPPRDAPNAVVPSGPPVLVDEVGRGQGVESGELVDGSTSLSRGMVGEFMKRGPAFALTQVVVEPVHGASGFVGFKVVSASREAQEFLRPHVKTGDVITHLNGVRVERPDDYLRAWNALKDTSVIRIDFVRDNEPSVATWAVQ